MAAGTSGNPEAVGKTADVDGKALPGSELVNRASRVDKANKMPDRRQSQSQQAELYHKESQCNENAKRNIPSAHGVPLEGEWSVCASSRVGDLKVSTSGRVRSNSCEDGMGEHGWIDEWSWQVEMPRPIVQIPKGCCQLGRADSNASCKEMSADGQGESGKLVPTTVKTVCTVWVAATSDEVHSTQGLLEAQGDSQRLGKRGNREWGKTQSLLRCK